jgi:hypothetical protein
VNEFDSLKNEPSIKSRRSSFLTLQKAYCRPDTHDDKIA